MAGVWDAAGIDIVSIASNHAMDWGPEAMLDTVDFFRGKGKLVIGDDGKQIRLGEKPSRAAVQWMYDRMYKLKYTPTAALMEGNDQQMFIGGKLAILVDKVVISSPLPSCSTRYRPGNESGDAW
jgi:hypothetical protein